MSTLFDLEIKAVQPLQGPTGAIFYQRFKYSSNSQSRKQEQIEKEVKHFYDLSVSAYRDIDASWYSYREGMT